jgi:hypothetical protein
VFKDLVLLLTVPVNSSGINKASDSGGMSEFRDNSGEVTVQKVMQSLEIHDYSIFA